MTDGNQSSAVEFVLLFFSDRPFQQRVLLFLLLLVLYLLALVLNLSIIVLVAVDAHLQTPMFYFLGNVSFVELCFPSIIMPKIMQMLLAEKRSMSFVGCATQMYFFLFFGTATCFIPAVMGYDRYMAICYPLHYPAIMNKRVCHQIAAACWASSVLLAMGPICYIFTLKYHGSNRINHFFCDITPVVNLATNNTAASQIATSAYTLLVVFCPFLITLYSYLRILNTVMRMPSAIGRRKAFSTCGSHLTCVLMLYGFGTLNYIAPYSNDSLDEKRPLGAVYLFFIAVWNPLIYTVQNKKMKEAFRRHLLSRRR